MPRETPDPGDSAAPLGERFVLDMPEPVDFVYCDRCDLPIKVCRCGVDSPSALNHLRAIIAAGHRVPGNIEVPKQLWDALAAAEDYLLTFHPEE